MSWEEQTVPVELRANMVFTDMMDIWLEMHKLLEEERTYTGALEARGLSARFRMHAWYLAHAIVPTRWSSADQVQEDFRDVYVAMADGKEMTNALLEQMAAAFFGTGK